MQHTILPSAGPSRALLAAEPLRAAARPQQRRMAGRAAVQASLDNKTGLFTTNSSLLGPSSSGSNSLGGPALSARTSSKPMVALADVPLESGVRRSRGRARRGARAGVAAALCSAAAAGVPGQAKG